MENLLGVTKSNLFNLGMDILFSQFIHVSFFVITCMRHFKNAKKSRASLISQSLVGSLLIIYTEDSLYIVPCIFFVLNNGPTSLCAIRHVLGLDSKVTNNFVVFKHFNGLTLNYKTAFLFFVLTCRDSSGKVGVDLVVYSSAKSEDFASYYSRLEALLADESAMGNALKPSQVSRKSVTVRSASKYTKQKSFIRERKFNVIESSCVMQPRCSSRVYSGDAGIFKIRDLRAFLREAKRELFSVFRSVFNRNVVPMLDEMSPS